MPGSDSRTKYGSGELILSMKSIQSQTYVYRISQCTEVENSIKVFYCLLSKLKKFAIGSCTLRRGVNNNYRKTINVK